MAILEEQVLQALSQVHDPELHRDLVSLGMISNIRIENDKVSFDLVLTTPACPLREQIAKMAREAVARLPGVKDVQIRISAKVPKGVPDKSPLLGVKNIIAIGSGKGGVGKTTVAVNLSVALARMNIAVGLLDADIYGPNVPRMLGVRKTPDFDGEKILPLQAWGLKVMSLGFLVNEDFPVIWRGPILARALQQLLFDIRWGELDYLLVDLPPGCLTADTLVFTDEGPIPISGVEEDMHVYSFDGRLNKANHKSPWELHATLVKRKVLAVIPQGKAKVYEVKTATRCIKGTGDHPLLVLRRSKQENSRFYSYSLDWAKLGELNQGDIVLIVKKLPDPHGEPLRLPKTTEGYCDADGYQRALKLKRRRHGLMGFESPNKPLMEDLRALGIYTGLKVGNPISHMRTVQLPSTGRLLTQTSCGFEANQVTKTSLYGAEIIRGSIGRGLYHEYIGFERVKEVRFVGFEKVYDLHVEGEHNFVANGFIVHNTGDVQLSLAQLVPVTGAVIVTTPQDVALYDALKGLATFERLNVPVLGVVENMRDFICPHCYQRTEIFRRGAVEVECRRRGIRYLGAVPILPEISEGSDLGHPVTATDQNSPATKAFIEIASQLAASISVQNLTRMATIL